jgi:hypothetical protein
MSLSPSLGFDFSDRSRLHVNNLNIISIKITDIRRIVGRGVIAESRLSVIFATRFPVAYRQQFAIKKCCEGPTKRRHRIDPQSPCFYQ